MAMAADEIERLIRDGDPRRARSTIRDLAGDGDHYAARVVSRELRRHDPGPPAPAGLYGAGRPHGRRIARAAAETAAPTGD